MRRRGVATPQELRIPAPKCYERRERTPAVRTDWSPPKSKASAEASAKPDRHVLQVVFLSAFPRQAGQLAIAFVNMPKKTFLKRHCVRNDDYPGLLVTSVS
jgi:hypothetical protein